PRLRKDLLRVLGADAVDVRKGVLDFLVPRQIHTCNACHALPLPLLVFGAALADDPEHAPSLDDAAMLTDRFDAGPYLQDGRSRERNYFPVEPGILGGAASSRKGRDYGALRNSVRTQSARDFR